MKKAILIMLKVLGAVIASALIACLILLLKDPNKSRPPHQDGANGYVRATGTNLYDGEGNILQLKGVNLGNWFIQEYWMTVSAVGDFDTGVYTQLRGDAAMRSNPNLSEEEIDALNALYLDSFIQETDFQIISELGMNAVRIPFTWFNLTQPDGRTLRPRAFEKLDWAVSMCEKYGLYAILDLHGAIGSQNMDIHSGDDSQFDLYGNEENMRLTCELWAAIAEHYKENRTVAAYDLLNEPRRAPHKFGGKLNFDFYDRLYRTVRGIDVNHLILIECFSFPVNGARLSGYNWSNICMEYHIYNLSPFSQLSCLRFYKILHNLMGYDVPVLVGEWNAFEKESEWADSFAWFDRLGWSFTSWTYKANRRLYSTSLSNRCNWGLYELDMDPVDLSSATAEEIAAVYSSVTTESAQQTVVYRMWKEYLGG